jgi:hypothetical protein
MQSHHVINVQDLPAEQANLVRASAEFLRGQSIRAHMPDIAWSEESAPRLADEWDHEEDAGYDNRQERYQVEIS